jgi:chitodextrinase
LNLTLNGVTASSIRSFLPATSANVQQSWSNTSSINISVPDHPLVLEISTGPITAPDLIVQDITWSPASPATGNNVTFSAVVKNQGNAATPANTIIGVAFSVNGTVVSWSDNSSTSLAAGATRTLTANGGPNSGAATWTAGANGSYTVSATVDDINRIPGESNESNNTLTKSLTVGATADTQAPTAPTNLAASNITTSSVTLSWSASTDNVGVAGYDVYQGTTKINTANITATTYNVTGLAASTTYSFTVKARDAAGNTSAASNAVNITTQAPATPVDLIITDITWTPASPATGNAVTFSAVVKNQGGTATPAGTIIGVAFSVNGTVVSWSDNNSTSLAAGASRTLTANSGPSGVATWTAGTAGNYTVSATVDDINRIPGEADENNNTFSKSLTVESTTISNGTYTLTPECAQANRLDVSGGNTTDGTNVQTWTDNGLDPQRWIAEKQTDGSYRLSSKLNTGKVLDVANSGTADGTNVRLWSWNGSNAQKWNITAVGNGYYKLTPLCAPGKCLDVAGGSSAAGANVQIWTDNGSTAQRWKFNLVSTGTTSARMSDRTALTIEEPGAVSAFSLQLKPNPASSNVSVLYTSGSAGEATISLTDMSGHVVVHKKVKLEAGTNNLQMDVSALPGGIYIVKMMAGGKTTAARLVVNK